MAQRTRAGTTRQGFPGIRTFDTAALSARQRLSGLWTREALFRLVLSVVLALALWVYITGKQDPTIAWDYSQPIQVVAANVPDGLTVTTNLTSVHVRIRVDNRNRQVTPASFHAFVSLQGLSAGTHNSVPVQVVPDPGISILRISPSRVPIVIEKMTSRHVPVRWHILSQPPGGYSTSSVVVEPNTVDVTGPSSLVAEVTQVGIYIDLSQARSGISGNYKVSPENSQGDPISGASRLLVDPGQVRVRVTVGSLNGYKTLPVLVSFRGHPRPGIGVVAVTVRPSDITAFGIPSVLGKVRSVNTLRVSLDGRGGGKATTRVPLSLPIGVTSRIKKVTVTVQLAPVNTSNSIEIGVSPQNLPAGLAVHTRPATIVVTVVGPLADVQAAARHVHAIVNLYGLGVGTYQLKPQLQTGRSVQVEGVYPDTLTVTLVASSR